MQQEKFDQLARQLVEHGPQARRTGIDNQLDRCWNLANRIVIQGDERRLTVELTKNVNDSTSQHAQEPGPELASFRLESAHGVNQGLL